MFLLDTDTIIYSLKGHEHVVKNLQNHFQDALKISVITLMALYYNAHKSQKIESNITKIKTLERALDIIPNHFEAAEIFGILKSKLEKRGLPIDDFDLILASTALTHKLTLVTNNENISEESMDSN